MQKVGQGHGNGHGQAVGRKLIVMGLCRPFADRNARWPDRIVPWAFAFTLLAATGCSVSHQGLGGDGGVPLDAGPDGALPSDAALDMGLADAGRSDVPTDVGGPDAPEVDAGMDAGADGGVDAGTDADPCAGGPDSDGDGVPDVCDRCPGGSDVNDYDGDGLPDGCDDWWCGERPTVPAVVSADQITISNVSLGAGGGNTVMVVTGEPVRLSFDWLLDDVACPGCYDLIEIGTQEGKSGCIWQGNPPPGGQRGRYDVTAEFAGGGVFELRSNLRQDFGCGGADWWGGAPESDSTFGVVCVVAE